MDISNSNNNEIAVNISQNNQFFDVLNIQKNSNVVMYVSSNANVGILTSSPNYELDVNGFINAPYFRGDGSLLQNAFLDDRSTTLLSEGSNLYFTTHRVDEIVSSSNARSSNFIDITSNLISALLNDTSNIISDRLSTTSNLISERINLYSNLFSTTLSQDSNIISYRLGDTSNLISNRLSDIHLTTSNVITDLNTDFIAESDNLYYTEQRFDDRFASKTLDDFYDGTSNRFIVNDTYISDLDISATIYTSNMSIIGSLTSFNTYTFQTENMIVDTQSDNNVALSIKQQNITNTPIIEILNDSDNGLHLYTKQNLDVSSNTGFMGINKVPDYELDVAGPTKSTLFKGDASQLFNVNIDTIDTSYLPESSIKYR
jgi:hypothetical protein